MIVKLLIGHHLEFLSLKGVYTCQNITLLKISCTGSIVIVSYASCWCVCGAFVSVPCSPVVTYWERADLLAAVCVVFSCVLSLSQMCPGPH